MCQTNDLLTMFIVLLTAGCLFLWYRACLERKSPNTIFESILMSSVVVIILLVFGYFVNAPIVMWLFNKTVLNSHTMFAIIFVFSYVITGICTAVCDLMLRVRTDTILAKNAWGKFTTFALFETPVIGKTELRYTTVNTDTPQVKTQYEKAVNAGSMFIKTLRFNNLWSIDIEELLHREAVDRKKPPKLVVPEYNEIDLVVTYHCIAWPFIVLAMFTYFLFDFIASFYVSLKMELRKYVANSI